MTTATSTDVIEGHNYWGKDMFWIGENLTVTELLNRFLYLKDEFGLSNSRLAFSIGIAESTLSRIFSKKHTPNRTTLVALDVALAQWESFYIDKDEDE